MTRCERCDQPYQPDSTDVLAGMCWACQCETTKERNELRLRGNVRERAR
jgi:hypothetical protein